MEATRLEDIPTIIADARKAFNQGKTRSLEFRKQQLLALHKLVTVEFSALSEAVMKDVKKHPIELEMMETNMISADIAEAIDHLSSWTATQKPSVPLVNTLDGCQIRPEPLGVVLIIGAWNYPIQLVLVPLVGAIAAGNCAIIKPSEISPYTAQALATLLPKYLDPQCFKIINGGIPETTAILKEKFDHILYTGNGNVAKIIMKAAAEHLTPVTLELGGKSPVFILDDADLSIAARRIVWGRFCNAGQTCIAPDYVLCTKETQDKIIPEMKKAITEYYSENPKESEFYGKIVNKQHFHRVSKMIENEKVALGGQVDEEKLYIAPTVLINVTLDSPSMKDEIFGPLLPIYPVASVDEAIEFVNSRDKPLALYVFGKSKSVLNKVVNSTSSGGVVVNDTLMHVTVSSLPFGGVGPSGMGAYHGKHSFDMYSHMKPVMFKDESLEQVNVLRYPPYTEKKKNILMMVMGGKPKESSWGWGYLGLGLIGVAVTTFSYLA